MSETDEKNREKKHYDRVLEGEKKNDSSGYADKGPNMWKKVKNFEKDVRSRTTPKGGY
jgi:hypothetical protein